MRHAALAALTALGCLQLSAQISPVEQRIFAAQRKIQSDPKSWQAFNELASAFCRKGRDTSETAMYDRAQAALDRSFHLSPGNYDGQKLQVTVWLGKREFGQALKLATELNARAHDDIGVWGLLVDCNTALGNYAEAKRDAQWILDLRSGSSLGFEKAAGLRVHFGDPEGAIEFYDEANRRISANDADEHAWLLTQIATLQLASGNLKQAEDRLVQALKLFPDSQLALSVQAKLRTAEAMR
ncbi:MAG TPA: tetratricopeptide repeat protein [Bryobacteraceae bacterium]|jgi:tetratricopeptide (TPR) repeat protein|nr:tetratricopeptide repeat protein [Bryobacteraceae bacterium]